MKTLYNTFLKSLFRLVSCLVLFAGFYSLKAQNTCFNAVDTVGCPPFTVRIQECVADPTAQFRYDFGQGPTFDTSFTYQDPGFYSIEQIVQIGNDIYRTTKTNYIRVVAQSEPQFTLYACKDNNLKIQIDEDVYDHYVIEYTNSFENDTIDGFSSITTTFSSTSNQTVTVRGIYDEVDCENTTTKSMQLIPDLEIPKVNSVTTSDFTGTDFSAEINFTATPDFSYYISSKSHSGSFQVIDTIENQNGDYTYNLNNLSVSDSPYQIKVTNFDYCGNISESAVFSTQVLAATNESEQITLNWQNDNSITFNNFSLLKNNTETFNSATETNYLDQNILCGTEYCYQLISETENINGSTVEIYSNTVCETGFSNQLPTAVPTFYSTVSETETTGLSWEYPNPESVLNFIITNTNTSRKDTISSELREFSYSDELSYETPNCYSIQVLDKCANLSENNPQTCPTLVNIEKTGAYTYLISWTEFSGFNSPLYTLILTDQNGATILSESNFSFQKEIDVRNYSVAQINVQLEISDTESTLVSYSNKELIDLKTYIFFPTGFTPNGDGLNDTFYPVGSFVKEYSLEIRNQWGQLVFSSENEPWDGFFKSNPAIGGVYIYKSKITDEKGVTYDRSGTVTLIR